MKFINYTAGHTNHDDFKVGHSFCFTSAQLYYKDQPLNKGIIVQNKAKENTEYTVCEKSILQNKPVALHPKHGKTYEYATCSTGPFTKRPYCAKVIVRNLSKVYSYPIWQMISPKAIKVPAVSDLVRHGLVLSAVRYKSKAFFSVAAILI